MTFHPDPPQPLTISVLIRTYTEKRLNYLKRTLHSITRQTLQPHEVIITVDHNRELMQSLQQQYPDLKIIANSRMRGSSGSLNTGIEAAVGDVIVLIDDDAVAEEDWLENLLRHYAHHDVLGVGGFIAPDWEGPVPRWLPREFYWVIGCSYAGLPSEAATVRNLIGCNMSIRRNVFDTVGGFREGFGHSGGRPSGCEETDVCIRASQSFPEEVFLYDPEAIVHHAVPDQRTSFRYYMWRCLLEGRSKALITRFVGTKRGLASEAQHALRILPMAMLRSVKEGFEGDLSGFSRAAAILVGLAATSGSYLFFRVWLFLTGFQPDEVTMIAETQIGG